MKEREQIKQWEAIAKEVLVDKGASCSHIESVLVGITRSKDNWLREQLEKKKEKAWKAANVKD